MNFAFNEAIEILSRAVKLMKERDLSGAIVIVNRDRRPIIQVDYYADAAIDLKTSQIKAELAALSGYHTRYLAEEVKRGDFPFDIFSNGINYVEYPGGIPIFSPKPNKIHKLALIGGIGVTINNTLIDEQIGALAIRQSGYWSSRDDDPPENPKRQKTKH